MLYQKVLWKHSDHKYPTVLFSEIDDDMWEVRKVEVFSDGVMHFADSIRTSGDTWLSDQRMPTVDEISQDPEFEAKEIGEEEFEEVWIKTLQKHRS